MKDNEDSRPQGRELSFPRLSCHVLSPALRRTKFVSKGMSKEQVHCLKFQGGVNLC